MKIQSIKVLTTGQGAKGPWTLVEATFEGQEGTFKGFYYEKPLQVGEEVQVELSKEEYKGKMEDRFKVISAKKAQSGVAEMAIKMEIARYGGEILRKLDLIMEKLEVRDFKAEIEKERNKEVTPVTFPDVQKKDEEEINPDDIPF